MQITRAVPLSAGHHPPPRRGRAYREALAHRLAILIARDDCDTARLYQRAFKRGVALGARIERRRQAPVYWFPSRSPWRVRLATWLRDLAAAIDGNQDHLAKPCRTDLRITEKDPTTT